MSVLQRTLPLPEAAPASGWRPASRRSAQRQRLLGVLDVGTSKVSCCIAVEGPTDPLRVIGTGHQESGGMRRGAVTDMDAVEQAIRAAVSDAERAAGVRLHQVVASVSCGGLASAMVGMQARIGAGGVREADLERLLARVRDGDMPPGRELLHAVPVRFCVDGNALVRDPRGMHGRVLGVDVHVVSVETGPLRTLAACIERCHLEVAGFAAAPYASGLAVLVDDEMSLGAVCVDMGGGVSSLAMFLDGAFVRTDAVPVGGAHVTGDIARGLSTPPAAAERLKTLCGSALAGPDTPAGRDPVDGYGDYHDTVDAPQMGEDDDSHADRVPRSRLTGIIAPRLEETLELLRARLEACPPGPLDAARIVLTGGASQLADLGQLAAHILGRRVRLGGPVRLPGLAEYACAPAFATCIGLLLYARDRSLPGRSAPAPARRKGRLLRLWRWLGDAP